MQAMDSFYFDIALLIICLILWISRVIRLAVIHGGTECDGRIVGFSPVRMAWLRYEGWGYMYTRLVEINFGDKAVIAESAEKVLAANKSDLGGKGDEMTVIYNPKNGKCVLHGFGTEIFLTVLLAAFTLFSVGAFLYDLMLIG
ncbi:MAG: hypothetical protein ACI4J5_05050 [Oscillospiraceae bacterium]